MSIGALEGFHEPPAKADAWLYVDEISHRMLNDYTVMLSMLRRASADMKDVAGAAALDAVATRMRAAATVHGALRLLRGSSVRNLDEDLAHLCASLTLSTLADRSIRLRLACEPVIMSARRTWQISLIVSELVMNAAKHAFSVAGGDIVISIHAVGATVECAVADNSQGDPAWQPGRGSRIVDALVMDLGGSVVRRFSRTGSMVAVSIPLA